MDIADVKRKLSEKCVFTSRFPHTSDLCRVQLELLSNTAIAVPDNNIYLFRELNKAVRKFIHETSEVLLYVANFGSAAIGICQKSKVSKMLGAAHMHGLFTIEDEIDIVCQEPSLAELEACIRFTLEVKLSPLAYRIGSYYIVSGDLMQERCSNNRHMKHSLIELELHIVEGKMYMMVTPMRLRIPTIQVSSLFDDGRYEGSGGSHTLADHKTLEVIPPRACVVLPLLQSAYVVSVSKSLEGNAFSSSYHTLQAFWRDQHSYRLPPQCDVYYGVRFYQPVTGYTNKVYTYPGICVREPMYTVYRELPGGSGVQEFIGKVLKRMPSVFGLPLDLHLGTEPSPHQQPALHHLVDAPAPHSMRELTTGDSTTPDSAEPCKYPPTDYNNNTDMRLVKAHEDAAFDVRADAAYICPATTSRPTTSTIAPPPCHPDIPPMQHSAHTSAVSQRAGTSVSSENGGQKYVPRFTFTPRLVQRDNNNAGASSNPNRNHNQTGKPISAAVNRNHSSTSGNPGRNHSKTSRKHISESKGDDNNTSNNSCRSHISSETTRANARQRSASCMSMASAVAVVPNSGNATRAVPNTSADVQEVPSCSGNVTQLLQQQSLAFIPQMYSGGSVMQHNSQRQSVNGEEGGNKAQRKRPPPPPPPRPRDDDDNNSNSSSLSQQSGNAGKKRPRKQQSSQQQPQQLDMSVVPQYAAMGNLSQCTAATLCQWLVSRGVVFSRSRARKQELIDLVIRTLDIR